MTAVASAKRYMQLLASPIGSKDKAVTIKPGRGGGLSMVNNKVTNRVNRVHNIWLIGSIIGLIGLIIGLIIINMGLSINWVLCTRIRIHGKSMFINHQPFEVGGGFTISPMNGCLNLPCHCSSSTLPVRSPRDTQLIKWLNHGWSRQWANALLEYHQPKETYLLTSFNIKTFQKFPRYFCPLS